MMCSSKETFPSPLHLGKLFWEAHGKSLLVVSRRGSIALHKGTAIDVGRITRTGWKVTTVGATASCKVRVLHNDEVYV